MKKYVNQPGLGRVLVIDAGGARNRAVLGDLMAGRLVLLLGQVEVSMAFTGAAVKNGWSGIIVNGCIRDADVVDQLEIGVKALGEKTKIFIHI